MLNRCPQSIYEIQDNNEVPKFTTTLANSQLFSLHYSHHNTTVECGRSAKRCIFVADSNTRATSLAGLRRRLGDVLISLHQQLLMMLLPLMMMWSSRD